MSCLAGGYKVSEEPVASIFRFIMLSSLARANWMGLVVVALAWL